MYKTIIFSLVMCLCCSLMLTFTATWLKPYQLQNILIDQQTNILKSVGLIDSHKIYSDADISDMYNRSIKCLWLDPSGRVVPTQNTTGSNLLHIYLYMKNDEIEAYAIPIDTRGLWGTISGYLALKNDGQTIIGFTVYKHFETPGLGGEIEKTWFQKNFQNKKIVNQQGQFVSVGVAKGKADQSVSIDHHVNFVDGISGATLTGKYLTEGFKEILAEYEPVSIQFRQQRASYLTQGGSCKQ
ncbi:MAG: FMN-binding protein [Desulfobacterales bacterium]|nr:FMN-binding protein [Desulfobacterales bacterium]